jgi:hypothetical protein
MHNIVIWGIEALLGVTVIIVSRRSTPAVPKPPNSSLEPVESVAAVNGADYNGS